MPFKIYAAFEDVLKENKSSDKNNTSYTKKYQDPGKNAGYRFIEAILKEYDYCKKIIKNQFNKNVVMSAEDEERFQ